MTTRSKSVKTYLWQRTPHYFPFYIIFSRSDYTIMSVATWSICKNTPNRNRWMCDSADNTDTHGWNQKKKLVHTRLDESKNSNCLAFSRLIRLQLTRFKHLPWLQYKITSFHTMHTFHMFRLWSHTVGWWHAWGQTNSTDFPKTTRKWFVANTQSDWTIDNEKKIKRKNKNMCQRCVFTW